MNINSQDDRGTRVQDLHKSVIVLDSIPPRGRDTPVCVYVCVFKAKSSVTKHTHTIVVVVSYKIFIEKPFELVTNSTRERESSANSSRILNCLCSINVNLYEFVLPVSHTRTQSYFVCLRTVPSVDSIANDCGICLARFPQPWLCINKNAPLNIAPMITTSNLTIRQMHRKHSSWIVSIMIKLKWAHLN